MPDHTFWRICFVVAACLFAVYLVAFRSSYFTNPMWLGALIFLQVLAAILLKYRQAFFPALVLVFFFAGSSVPAHELWTSVRWVVLAAGAGAGFIVWLKCNHLHLGAIHLIALACVLTAIVSALVSVYPGVTLLKALSLLLLFLYAITGGRVALAGREAQFLSSLLLGCELLVYISAVAYFVLHIELFGNRNSLGVAMGVVALPFLLWGLLVSETRFLRCRRIFALLLCQLLLLSSYERAGIIAALTSSVLLCVALRRYRVILTGLLLALATALAVASLVPLPVLNGSDDVSLSSRFVYKGNRDMGLLASRQTVWEKTISSLQEHPWFGTGFGTSATAYDKTQIEQKFSSAGQVTREHGNSYLAIAEWVGFVGVIPFAILLGLLVINVIRVCVWMRQTGIAASPAVPLAVFVAGGLVHAGFEDWLFAVGYHTCILFWVCAFILTDFAPITSARRLRYFAGQYASSACDRSFGQVASVQTCTFS